MLADHHGVHYQRKRKVGRAPSNRLDDFAGTERASFCRVRWDVLQHGIQLGEDEARCQRFHRVHAAGILHGQQGQDTHAVYVPLVKGLQVGLNAGTTRRIPTRRWSRQSASCCRLQHGGEEIQFAPHGVLVGIPDRQGVFRYRVQ